MTETNTANIGFEKEIWDAACILRGNMDAAEYKQAVSELKEKLGTTSITLDEIADCIMRIPDYHESYNAFKEINTILVGTVWQTKAQDVLKKILEKQGEQLRPIINHFAKDSVRFEAGSTMNGNVVMEEL